MYPLYLIGINYSDSLCIPNTNPLPAGTIQYRASTLILILCVSQKVDWPRSEVTHDVIMLPTIDCERFSKVG